MQQGEDVTEPKGEESHVERLRVNDDFDAFHCAEQ
jgi:hypothetical protein